MLETSLIMESIVSLLVNQISKQIFLKPQDRARFDFVFQDSENQTIAIEVKTAKISKRILERIANVIKETGNLDRFYLLTPEAPSDEEKILFDSIIRKAIINSYWLSLNEYFKTYNIDIENNEDINNLQIAGITSQMQKYKEEHIGDNVFKNYLGIYLNNFEEAKKGNTRISPIKMALQRQFPLHVIDNMPDDIEEIKTKLLIGNPYNKAIIILSDIKNFSTLVSASDPEDLRDLMSKYYIQARDLVFKYSGILDKFIGDAVLAIFNYPEYKEDAIINAMKFSSDLIIMGKQLLMDMQRNMDNAIETGTRIGITIGTIYPLSIGKDFFEVTFIGDKINLAARLESKCLLNGILVSNQVVNEINKNKSPLKNSVTFTAKQFPREEMKGQITDIQALQIEEDQLKYIALS
jgi:adenylate cyclase